MLVLSRRLETEIRIGSDITIRVLEIHKRQVKLGIEAPSAVRIRRREVVPVRACAKLIEGDSALGAISVPWLLSMGVYAHCRRSRY